MAAGRSGAVVPRSKPVYAGVLFDLFNTLVTDHRDQMPLSKYLAEHGMPLLGVVSNLIETDKIEKDLSHIGVSVGPADEFDSDDARRLVVLERFVQCAAALDFQDGQNLAHAKSSEKRYVQSAKSLSRSRMVETLLVSRRDATKLTQLWHDWDSEFFSEPFHDTIPTLGRIRDLGIPQVVVSNWAWQLRRALDRAGINEFFAKDCVVGSAQAGARKPNPLIFSPAVELLDVPPAQLLMVGDKIHADIRGATKAGIPSVFIKRSAKEPVSVVFDDQVGEVLRVNSLEVVADLVRDPFGFYAELTGEVRQVFGAMLEQNLMSQGRNLNEELEAVGLPSKEAPHVVIYGAHEQSADAARDLARGLGAVVGAHGWQATVFTNYGEEHPFVTGMKSADALAKVNATPATTSPDPESVEAYVFFPGRLGTQRALREVVESTSRILAFDPEAKVPPVVLVDPPNNRSWQGFNTEMLELVRDGFATQDHFANIVRVRDTREIADRIGIRPHRVSSLSVPSEGIATELSTQ